MTAGSISTSSSSTATIPKRPPRTGRGRFRRLEYYTRLTQRLVAALAAPTAEGSPMRSTCGSAVRAVGPARDPCRSLQALPAEGGLDLGAHGDVARPPGRRRRGADTASLEHPGPDRRHPKGAGWRLPPTSRRCAADRAGENRGQRFDVKLAPGGMIDCEFAAQFLVLAGLGRMPGRPAGRNVAAGCAGGNASCRGRAARRIGRNQSAILQVLRITGEPAFEPDKAPDALQRILVASVQSALRGIAHEVAAQEIPPSKPCDRPGRNSGRDEAGARGVLGAPVG